MPVKPSSSARETKPQKATAVPTAKEESAPGAAGKSTEVEECAEVEGWRGGGVRSRDPRATRTRFFGLALRPKHPPKAWAQHHRGARAARPRRRRPCSGPSQHPSSCGAYASAERQVRRQGCAMAQHAQQKQHHHNEERRHLEQENCHRAAKQSPGELRPQRAQGPRRTEAGAPQCEDLQPRQAQQQSEQPEQQRVPLPRSACRQTPWASD